MNSSLTLFGGRETCDIVRGGHFHRPALRTGNSKSEVHQRVDLDWPVSTDGRLRDSFPRHTLCMLFPWRPRSSRSAIQNRQLACEGNEKTYCITRISARAPAAGVHTGGLPAIRSGGNADSDKLRVSPFPDIEFRPFHLRHAGVLGPPDCSRFFCVRPSSSSRHHQHTRM